MNNRRNQRNYTYNLHCCLNEMDEETELYYYGMRYYEVWLCKFINVDPWLFKYPYYTPFQYAGNKPITYIDLDGEEEVNPETGTIEGTIYLKFEEYVISHYKTQYLNSFRQNLVCTNLQTEVQKMHIISFLNHFV